ncbi:DoxX family protein [Leptolyngbya sp. FACHB-17]|uniref:DoxX family protein n=1 Tax=unclassified Leptolyngbya TaxID=2650499 RepID=UPI00167FFC69|nr:DoxX family protein [Leptolyngbya sp. FACHB-17]MBD2079388.1 DoxX family protein [Leptolyngbya sp. FACHB-17]
MTVTPSGRSPLSTILQSDLSLNPAFQAVWLGVRVLVGALMIHNGFSKLADVQGFVDNVMSVIGFPFPLFFTYCAAYTEIVASILLIFGFFTRISALSLTFTMLIAVYFHLKKTGLDVGPVETASLYMLIYLLFTVGGGGNFSIDHLLSRGRSNS